ncbi:DUF3300 domain-containing protein [[Enterobacter] lignolyticus]|uniref:DUF3300 domain-containing protein n=1 Tax=[Enterobacter] lignolyticus TaxID=1334193 RepID=A0A806XA41_9ENTR|nr:DUF3300 domain-containing protein [[Enterobacter] lignolyticus]ALR75471.1 hypothetical protein AO703_03860 [[Enterobacter] lignolyticus]
MTLPFKPHVLAIICSAGLLAAAGTLYVKSRAPETITPAPAPAATQPAPAPATVAAPAAAPAVAPAPAPAATQPVTTTYTTAQIDQWVAPIALYPDNLLSQVLMASTYPTNVMQAVQWSQDNPTMQGDAAVQAVANQPWDPSVKSLVAFPQLLALMGENPPWVESLGDAFLAQPQDVMNSVQKLRALAQQTGALKSTPQQKVTTTTKTAQASSTSSTSSSSTTTVVPASSTQVIKIESADPNVVYVPTYNPSTVYGTWPSTAYPPVYLPPPPGEQFASSFMNGLGFSLGVATTYALFSDINWDDDDYYHHHGDGGGYNRNGDNNININVNDFNRVTGQRLQGSNVNWQHNPNYRNNVPYPNSSVNQRFHQTNVSGGLSATQAAPTQAAVNRNNQRQAAMNQFQQRTGTTAAGTGAGVAARNANTSRDVQRQAASKQMNQITQRSNYRGYDNTPGANNQQRRETAKNQAQRSGDQQQRREAAQKQTQRLNTQQQQQRREQVQPQRTAATSAQRQQRNESLRANALSGNDSRSPSWQAQRDRGVQSRNISGASREQRPARSEQRERRHR